MYKDKFGTIIKDYNDYVRQARIRGETDMAYEKAETRKRIEFTAEDIKNIYKDDK